MDLMSEDVSIVIKDSEEDLLIRNQHLSLLLDEANEKIRMLEEQLNQFKDAGAVVNMVKRKYTVKRRQDADTDNAAASVLSTMNGSEKKRRGGKSGGEDSGDDGVDGLDTGFESAGSMKGGGGGGGSSSKQKFCFSDVDDRRIVEAYNAYMASDGEAIQSENGILKKWQFVADYLNNGATAHQVGRRWREKLDPSLSTLKSGTFSQEEDEKLLRLIEEHISDGRGGGKNWTSISSKMNRKPKECEHRGATLLAKHQKQGSFSPEEDEVLMKLHAEGKSFNEIGRMMNRKPKRCADRLDTLTDAITSHSQSMKQQHLHQQQLQQQQQQMQQQQQHHLHLMSALN